MSRESSSPPPAGPGVEKALAQVRGASALRRATVDLALTAGWRLGGAGKRRVCCQSGCAGCPWTKVVERRVSRGLEVQIDDGDRAVAIGDSGASRGDPGDGSDGRVP